MTLNEYQEQAMGTCMESSHNFGYMMLNLVGEVGELASKVAKSIRKGKMVINENELGWELEGWEQEALAEYPHADDEAIDAIARNNRLTFNEELKKEAGDILWQLAGLCKVMGWSLNEVAALNLEKLAARKEAGTIDGNGDGVSGKERTV